MAAAVVRRTAARNESLSCRVRSAFVLLRMFNRARIFHPLSARFVNAGPRESGESSHVPLEIEFVHGAKAFIYSSALRARARAIDSRASNEVTRAGKMKPMKPWET